MSLLLAMTEWRPEPWKERLQALLPGRRIDTLDTVDRNDVRYALTWRHPPGSLQGLPKLEVIFSMGAGVDHVFADPRPPEVPVVRVVDPDLTQRMSEWVALQVLLHHRQFRRYDRQQRERIWDEDENSRRRGEVRVGLLGLGVLGLEAARKLTALGFDVAGWSRTPKVVDGLATFPRRRRPRRAAGAQRHSCFVAAADAADARPAQRRVDRQAAARRAHRAGADQRRARRLAGGGGHRRGAGGGAAQGRLARRVRDRAVAAGSRRCGAARMCSSARTIRRFRRRRRWRKISPTRSSRWNTEWVCGI